MWARRTFDDQQDLLHHLPLFVVLSCFLSTVQPYGERSEGFPHGHGMAQKKPPTRSGWRGRRGGLSSCPAHLLPAYLIAVPRLTQLLSFGTHRFSYVAWS